MRPLVNLSSQPFRNRRLFWLAILLLFAVPSYFGLDAIDTLARHEINIKILDDEIQKQQSALKLVDKPARTNVTISADQNSQLVAASELVARRAFSWSQLLNDIERNLPAGVRVLRVEVTQIQPDERGGAIGGAENAATLSMTVIGKSGNDVTTMINKFNESERFKVFPISSKKVEGTDDIEFDLKVEYLTPAQAPPASLSNQIAEKK
jgi:Tfp pilus assembly protein PilN